MPLKLTIKPRRRWYSPLYLLYIGYFVWFEVQHRQFDFFAWFPLLAFGLSLVEFFTYREELEFHEDHLEWRELFAGFTWRSKRRNYADIDTIEWHEVRDFPGFSNPRRIAIARKDLKTLKVAVGASKEDLGVIREQIRLAQLGLADKFEFPDERASGAAQEA